MLDESGLNRRVVNDDVCLCQMYETVQGKDKTIDQKGKSTGVYYRWVGERILTSDISKD